MKNKELEIIKKYVESTPHHIYNNMNFNELDKELILDQYELKIGGEDLDSWINLEELQENGI